MSDTTGRKISVGPNAPIISLGNGESDLDCNNTIFAKVVDANVTFTTSNVPTVGAYMMTIKLNVVSGSVTWFSNVYWPNDTVPPLTVGESHLFSFFTSDGGNTWYGSSLDNYATLEGN